MYKIEKLHKEDYSRLIQIWESAVLATHHFLMEGDFEYYKSKLCVYFEHVELYGYKDENDILKGFLGVSADMIEMLFIDNAFRGKGVGKILLQYAIYDLGLMRVDVNADNAQALGFYEYYGFKEYGRDNCDSEGKSYPIIHLKLEI